jgi:ferritin
MLSDRFVAALNEQTGHEFAASQQYVAIAVHYDNETLPRLATHFYAQAVEERNHAMMIVQYLMDAGLDPVVPGCVAPSTAFEDVVAPVQLALNQERAVTDQINGLVGLARQDGDFASEQFLQWFLKEQVEEVSAMSDLLAVVHRARENPLLAEEYLSRESPDEEAADPTAPRAAGGAL